MLVLLFSVVGVGGGIRIAVDVTGVFAVVAVVCRRCLSLLLPWLAC